MMSGRDSGFDYDGKAGGRGGYSPPTPFDLRRVLDRTRRFCFWSRWTFMFVTGPLLGLAFMLLMPAQQCPESATG